MRPSCKEVNSRSRLLPALAGLLVVCCLTAFFCAVAFADSRPRIGIALPSFRESRWQSDIRSLEEQAERNQVDILVRFSGNDQKQQNAQIKEMVNLGINLLLVTPTDVFDASDGIRYAKERNIPVVCYDRLAENCPVDAYISFERFNVGERMGRFLAAVAPKGKYIILHGPKTDSNALDYSAGALKYLGPLIARGDICVVLEEEVAGWRPDIAEKLTEQGLAKDRDITAVLAFNDDTAGGVITALSRYNLAGKVYVTGQDATEGALKRIHDGVQSMTVFKDTHQLARKALQVSLQIVRDRPLPTMDMTHNGMVNVPTYFLPVMSLDASSLGWFLRSVEFH